ncbi:MAG: FdtA/QdtA family cupin domain-containing protein [Bacteroidaceae bacterium]|nr:FdtA/QdtA family cupin domain-containing protein [Bacteroidaceae bacterium]
MHREPEDTTAYPIVRLSPHKDERGELCCIENNKELPFHFERIFWIYDVPQGAERGGHAHSSCSEAIFPLSGGFDIFLDDGQHRQTIHLASPHEGIIVKAGVWCELKNFLPHTVCMVAASNAYDPTGYIHDYQQFLASKRCK